MRIEVLVDGFVLVGSGDVVQFFLFLGFESFRMTVLGSVFEKCFEFGLIFNEMINHSERLSPESVQYSMRLGTGEAGFGLG